MRPAIADGATATSIAGLVGAEILLPEGQRVLVDRELGDGLYDVRRLPSGEMFLEVDPLTGQKHMIAGDFFERLSARGELNIVRRRDAPPPVVPADTRTYTREEAERLDPYGVARLKVVRGLCSMGVGGDHPDLSRHLGKVWDVAMQKKFGERPEIRRVRAWFGRGDPETVGLVEMMSRSGRTLRRSPLDPALERIYARHANDYWYEKGRGWRVVDATADAAVERKRTNVIRLLAGEAPLDEVNRETMRRRINGLLCRDAYAAKFGEPAARRKFDGGGPGLVAQQILQNVIMDDHVLDVVSVVHEGVAGRAYLCASLDVHSRAAPALVASMTPPSHHTAALCLRRTNRSKVVPEAARAKDPALTSIGGKPVKLTVDNGKNYVSPAFVETCADLGITVEIAPVYMARAKAMIERFFHTLNTFLIQKLPGAVLDPKKLRELGIDPAAEAVVTLETLQSLIEEFLVYYHTRHHSGIGARPVDKWKKSMDAGYRHVLDSEAKLDALFGVVVHGRRITANGGVRIFGLTYKARDMRSRIIDALAGREPHRTRLEATTACTVKIRYDPADLGRIFVEVGSEWVPLQCTDHAYARGLSLWQHKQIRRFAKRKRLSMQSEEDALLARAELNRAIAEAFPDLKAQERRAASRFLVGEAPSGGWVVEHAVADPRHDGFAPAIGHDPAHGFREDRHRAPDRPTGGRSPDEDDDDRSDDEEIPSDEKRPNDPDETSEGRRDLLAEAPWASAPDEDYHDFD